MRRTRSTRRSPPRWTGITHPYLNVGLIEGGTNTNVIPGQGGFKLDRRMIPEENPAEVEALHPRRSSPTPRATSTRWRGQGRPRAHRRQAHAAGQRHDAAARQPATGRLPSRNTARPCLAPSPRPSAPAALGLQHVLVMYAGAVAVPLIVGRALKLSPEQVALLISADLFCCGIVTLIQSLGATQWFGIKLPVMMGVTFAAVGPMVAMANANPGVEGARLIFGAIIGGGVIIHPHRALVSRMLRFFPPVVTGTIIAVIGISLMRVGINWIFGNPVGPTAPWRRA
jgi:hypothetical protein